MKRKLILFITCFFLFSSLTVFFVHRHLRSPEVSKKENNEEEKKENKKEADDDLPWQFTWKGAIFSLIPSIVIALIMAFVVFFVLESKKDENKANKQDKDQDEANKDQKKEEIKTGAIIFFSLALTLTLLYLVVFPLLLAMKKYKDKSYGERFGLANSSSFVKKIFNIIVLMVLTFFTIILVYVCRNEDKGTELKKIEPLEKN